MLSPTLHLRRIKTIKNAWISFTVGVDGSLCDKYGIMLMLEARWMFKCKIIKCADTKVLQYGEMGSYMLNMV